MHYNWIPTANTTTTAMVVMPMKQPVTMMWTSASKWVSLFPVMLVSFRGTLSVVLTSEMWITRSVLKWQNSSVSSVNLLTKSVSTVLHFLCSVHSLLMALTRSTVYGKYPSMWLTSILHKYAFSTNTINTLYTNLPRSLSDCNPLTILRTTRCCSWVSL